ncbi:hypothetical protein AB0G02_36940, partial [Actinosynnema sp. NPDC023658]
MHGGNAVSASSPPRGDTVERVGDREVPDPYRVLEDPAAPETTRWCAEQDAAFDRARAGWTSGPAILADLHALTAFDHITAPVRAGGRSFTTWREPDGEHARLVVVDGDGLKALVTGSLDKAAFSDADFVIEAVFEDLGV